MTNTPDRSQCSVANLRREEIDRLQDQCRRLMSQALDSVTIKTLTDLLAECEAAMRRAPKRRRKSA